MAEYNFTMRQGETFSTTITVVDDDGAAIDLTGYSIYSRIKEKKSDTDALLVMSLANGRIVSCDTDTDVPDGALEVNEMQITVTAATTAALDFNVGYWDLELRDNGGNVTKLLEGIVTLQKEVTRSSEDDTMTDWELLGPFRIAGKPTAGYDYFIVPLPYNITIQRCYVSSFNQAGTGDAQIDIRNTASGGGDGIELVFEATDTSVEDISSELDIDVSNGEKLYIRVVTAGNLAEIDIILFGKR